MFDIIYGHVKRLLDYSCYGPFVPWTIRNTNVVWFSS